MSEALDPVRCPVCRARLRGTTACSRCGADLEPLMRVLGRAWLLRRRARAALEAQDGRAAEELAGRAQALQRTREGARLLRLGGLLAGGPPRVPAPR